MRDPAGEPASSMNCWFNPGGRVLHDPMIRLYYVLCCALACGKRVLQRSIRRQRVLRCMYCLVWRSLGAKNGARHSQPLVNVIPQGTSLPAPPE